jgi:excisionase family DNA binding protein
MWDNVFAYRLKNMNINHLFENATNVSVTVNLNDLKAVISFIVAEERERVNKEIALKNEKATLTREEVCTMLNISPSTLWRWSKDKYLRPVYIGSKVMYRRQDVDKLLKVEGC